MLVAWTTDESTGGFRTGSCPDYLSSLLPASCSCNPSHVISRHYSVETASLFATVSVSQHVSICQRSVAGLTTCKVLPIPTHCLRLCSDTARLSDSVRCVDTSRCHLHFVDVAIILGYVEFYKSSERTGSKFSSTFLQDTLG